MVINRSSKQDINAPDDARLIARKAVRGESMIMVRTIHYSLFGILLHKSALTLFISVLVLFSAPAYTLNNDSALRLSNLDDFAARLLCAENPDCVITEKTNRSAPGPLTIDGVTLPDDAARDRHEEQAVLVQYGAYLSEDGIVYSLEESEVSFVLPERGELSTAEYEGLLSETLMPILIRVPRTDGEKNSEQIPK